MAHTQFKDILYFKNNILAHDADWQFPAITEQHAYQQIRLLNAVPDGVTYIAFPWATLIDRMQRQTAKIEHHLAQFRAFCAHIPKETRKVTVCQHIKMKQQLDLFHLAGIDDVFWSHATYDDIHNASSPGPRIHPFPLFPVQAAEGTPSEPASGLRPHLFSFMGAKGTQEYLTQSRSWILDLLQNDPRGAITGRAGWHYNKIVYDHQIHAKNAKPTQTQELIDTAASDVFRGVLRASVFSLCPSGTGPNSIRLWESLGMGAIPVILAESWAPPGDIALWRVGCVFCPETPEAIQALPDRLAALAADPETLAKLRHGAQQLWTLYGPDGFVGDLQEHMLDSAVDPQQSAQHQPGILSSLTSDMLRPETSDRASAELFATCLANQLLHEAEDPAIPHALAAQTQARQILGDAHPLIQHLDIVTAFTKPRTPPPTDTAAPTAPPLITRGPLKVYLAGKHSNRTPLAYEPFQTLAEGRIALTDRLAEADIALTGFSTDLHDLMTELRDAQTKRPHLQIAVISEEPLWDSIWNKQLVERHQHIETADGHLDYHVFNHSNSDIFDFAEIPYFLLTRTAFLVRYGLGLARHRGLTPAALLRHWQNAPIPAAFYAEVRDTDAYRKTWPTHHVEGLSVYRTEIARATNMAGVQREGRGWRPDAKRQALTDWHLDKLTALDKRCRIVSAYENTHQHAYISEKIFDAFLVAGLPTYYADDHHRIHDMIPEAAMINTYGMDGKTAAQRIAQFSPDLGTAEIWLDTAEQLRSRLSNPATIATERKRVTEAVITALNSCLS